jgi:hypothetical protein
MSRLLGLSNPGGDFGVTFSAHGEMRTDAKL